MKPEKLLQLAREAQRNALAPYSNYQVGAALLTENGTVITGCNVESKAYPTTMCAERVAIYSALAQGYRKFQALAVVTNDGGSPCGGCRQVIYEYLGEIPIYIGDARNLVRTVQTSELFPYPFG